MTIVTMLSFAILLVFCAVALFSRDYRENWMQHIGLVGMGLTSASGIVRVCEMSWVPPEMMFFALGAVCYGTGTAVKVVRFRKRDDSKYRKPVSE